MIVADASAIIEALLNAASAAAVRRHLFAPGQTTHVPNLADVKVLHVLRRYSRSNTIGPTRVREALQDFSDLPLTRYPHDVLLPRMWDLRQNASAYDAAYLVLAEALEVPLLTCDRRLGSIPGHGAIVIVC